MNKIKFSHKYLKFLGIDIGEPVRLIQVWNTNTSELTEEFIDYDTAYIIGQEKLNYPLKVPMDCMVLFFMDCNRKLFTTLRRTTIYKAGYYNTCIGSNFKVVIEDKK